MFDSDSDSDPERSSPVFARGSLAQDTPEADNAFGDISDWDQQGANDTVCMSPYDVEIDANTPMDKTNNAEDSSDDIGEEPFTPMDRNHSLEEETISETPPHMLAGVQNFYTPHSNLKPHSPQVYHTPHLRAIQDSDGTDSPSGVYLNRNLTAERTKTTMRGPGVGGEEHSFTPPRTPPEEDAMEDTVTRAASPSPANGEDDNESCNMVSLKGLTAQQAGESKRRSKEPGGSGLAGAAERVRRARKTIKLWAPGEEREAFLAYEACVRVCIAAALQGASWAPHFLHKGACTPLIDGFALQSFLLPPGLSNSHEALGQRRRAGEDAQEQSADAAGARSCGSAATGDLQQFQVMTCSGEMVPGAHPGALAASLETGAAAAAASTDVDRRILIEVKSLRFDAPKEHGLGNRLKRFIFRGQKHAVQAKNAAKQAEIKAAVTAKKFLDKIDNGASRRVAEQLEKQIRSLKHDPKASAEGAPSSLPAPDLDAPAPARPSVPQCKMHLGSVSEYQSSQLVQPGRGDLVELSRNGDQEDFIHFELWDGKGHMGKAMLGVAAVGGPQVVPILSLEGKKCGHVELSLEEKVVFKESRPGDRGPDGTPVRTFGERLYALVLDAALRDLSFGARHLPLSGPWEGLLHEFSLKYGLRDAYCRLQYMTRITQGCATPTADCFQIVLDNLEPVLEISAEEQLTAMERHLLTAVQKELEVLLAHTFQNYKGLAEEAANGLVSDLRVLPEVLPAPALGLAARVYQLLHKADYGPQADANLEANLNHGALATFQRHAAAICPSPSPPADSAAPAEGLDASGVEPEVHETVAADRAAERAGLHQRLCNLCRDLAKEVQADLEIHDAVPPLQAISLPHLAATVYCQQLTHTVEEHLRRHTPEGPEPTCIDLMEALGDLQHRLVEEWRVDGMEFKLDVDEMFGAYIKSWLSAAASDLFSAFRTAVAQDGEAELSAAGPPSDAPGAAAASEAGSRAAQGERRGSKLEVGPARRSYVRAVELMYEQLHKLLQKYERILSGWPCYLLDVEATVCNVEREVLQLLEEECGAPLKSNKAIARASKASGKVAKKTAQGLSKALRR
ncbi:hypothetical protein CYMTET_51376 [Cymbomonas tetramitiformis]|uniref:Uncharacterized protein n=1 Tax=Cymbomonas tetramitiformis TaxID=36881 RepID=A0AAE0ESP6_9CHLO|nr:hypothetical protein CYMTET_51376 [Cymbomonas tetramitiformis]